MLILLAACSGGSDDPEATSPTDAAAALDASGTWSGSCDSATTASTPLSLPSTLELDDAAGVLDGTFSYTAGSTLLAYRVAGERDGAAVSLEAVGLASTTGTPTADLELALALALDGDDLSGDLTVDDDDEGIHLSLACALAR